MSDVVRVDFGKDAREAQRAYGRLAGLVEEQERDFLKDPAKFFRHAASELSRRDQFIRGLEDAIRPKIAVSPMAQPIAYEPLETVRVTKRDYELLQTLKTGYIPSRHVDGNDTGTCMLTSQ
jgi:hypothetical protein